MKRFIVFAFESSYEGYRTGVESIEDHFDTLEEAVQYCKDLPKHINMNYKLEFEVLDQEAMKVLYSSHSDRKTRLNKWKDHKDFTAEINEVKKRKKEEYQNHNSHVKLCANCGNFLFTFGIGSFDEEEEITKKCDNCGEVNTSYKGDISYDREGGW